MADRISRKDFLKITAGAGVIGVATQVPGLWNSLQNLTEEARMTMPDIEFSPGQNEKMNSIDEELKSLSEIIKREEGGEVSELSHKNMLIIDLANNLRKPGLRKYILENPDDFKVWLTGNGEYQYNYDTGEPAVEGGTPEYQNQVEEIFDTYMQTDRFRVGSITLTNIDRSVGNQIKWRAGTFNNNKHPSVWDDYAPLVHETTHTGIPVSELKSVKNSDKWILMPYGFDNTVAFFNEWLTAMNEEYGYFQNRFFRARGDAVLPYIREGKMSMALDEIIAMACTDYIFPPSDSNFRDIVSDNIEPFDKFPKTEAIIRKSIGYVYYGFDANKSHPEGVAKRKFQRDTEVSRVFWKIRNLAFEKQ